MQENTFFLTFCTTRKSLLTTTESAIIRTLVTADNNDLAARTIEVFSNGIPSSLVVAVAMDDAEVKREITSPAFLASSQASCISTATSSFSRAICSPTVTNFSTAFLTVSPTSRTACRPFSERLQRSLWLTNVVI